MDTKFTPWRHVWLYTKGWYAESDNRMDDLKRVIGAHTGCPPRPADIVSVLQDRVLDHISAHTTPAGVRQAVAKLLDYMKDYPLGEDNRGHMERLISAHATYMCCKVQSRPTPDCTFDLGDIGFPDEDVLPLSDGAMARIAELRGIELADVQALLQELKAGSA